MPRALAGGLVTSILLLVIGCGGGGGLPPSEELVPEGANLIAKVLLKEVLANQDIAELYAALPKDNDVPATLQGLLGRTQEKIGIDLRKFSQAVLFGNTDREDFFGLIAEGTFDRDALLLDIVQATGVEFTTAEYKGHELRTFTISEEEEEGALVFLDEETLAFGSPEAVRQVVDVLEGDRDSIGGDILATYNDLGDPWLKTAFQLPADALEGISEVPLDVPINLQTFRDIQVIGVALDKTGEEIHVRVAAHFATEQSASEAGDAIDGAVKLFRSFLPDEQIRALLNKLQVTTTGSVVTLTFETSTAEIRELIENAPDLRKLFD